MIDSAEQSSVGQVEPQTAHFSEPLMLACGRQLSEYQLVYETYGELNSSGSNAVLICHALSGHHHAARAAQRTIAAPPQQLVRVEFELEFNSPAMTMCPPDRCHHPGVMLA